MESIDHLTWRHFMVLLGGLSVDSRLVNVYTQADSAPLTGKAAERAFERF